MVTLKNRDDRKKTLGILEGFDQFGTQPAKPEKKLGLKQ